MNLYARGFKTQKEAFNWLNSKINLDRFTLVEFKVARNPSTGLETGYTISYFYKQELGA